MQTVETVREPGTTFLQDGLQGIYAESMRRQEMGEPFAPNALLMQLRDRIKERAGYEYPLHFLIDLYEMYAASRTTERFAQMHRGVTA